MSYLLRRTRKAAWVGETRSREAAVQEFARSVADTDGLSLFEVESDADRAAVISATACERQNTGRIDFIEIDREVLEKYGTVAKTPGHGTTPLASANALHCSLDWDDDALRQLAEYLFDNQCVPKEINTASVRANLQTLNIADISDTEAQAFVRAEQARGKKSTPPSAR